MTASKTLGEVLSEAADLLEKPGAWTRGTLARSKYQYPIGPREEKAVCWCMAGAVLKAAPSQDVADAAFEVIGKAVGRISDYNDAPERTQAEVVAALRQAAKEAGL